MRILCRIWFQSVDFLQTSNIRNNMKAFITGGTGFIGSHLVDSLIEEGGHELRCIVRKEEKWLEGKPYKKINSDLNNLPALQEAVEGVDIIFHLAGVVKSPDRKTFERVNVEATENLLRIAQRLKVPKVIILSSLAAAGPSFSVPITEDAPMLPVSRYGESKKRMEEIIHKISDNKTCITILRPSAVYGPREEDIYSFFKIAQKGICPIVGSGSGKAISLAHVDDIISGINLARKCDHTGIKTYFLASERGYDWHEIRDATSSALGKKLLTINVPSRFVRSIGTISETTASFFGKYPVMNEDKAKEMVLSWECSVEKARKELGYEQRISLMDGIKQTISWYKLHNWL
jgi:dihydroflavonol-4-reductase